MDSSGVSYITGGNFGVGNSSPNELLSLRHATSNTVLDFECLAANNGTTGNIIKFRGKGANGVSYHAAQIKGITENGANNAGFLSFWTNSAGTVAERLRITSAGDIHSLSSVQSGGNASSGFKIGAVDTACYIAAQGKSAANGGSAGNAVFQGWFGSNNTFRVNCDGTIKTSKGIDFSGAQTNTSGMTSELLDSYEEGSFTPQPWSSAGSISYSHAGSARQGRYTKIGNFVYFVIRLQLSSVSTANGQAFIIGLPFTASNGSGSIDSCHAFNINFYEGIGGLGSDTSITGRVAGGQSYILLQKHGDGSSASTYSANDWSGNWSIYGSGCYHTDS